MVCALKRTGGIVLKTIKYVVFTLLIITLGISTALLSYLHFFASADEDLSGEWIANLDMTEQAAVEAYSWLQDIEAVSVTMEDMEFYMKDLTIQINLTLEQTTRSEGTFHCSVSQESYEACNQAAYEAFAFAFQELLAERLHMAGYIDDSDREDIEAIVTDTFGMSTVSYLMSYGPALLPSLEELQTEYDSSGTYEIAEGILTRQFDAGQPEDAKSEYYFSNDCNLVLSEETTLIMY